MLPGRCDHEDAESRRGIPANDIRTGPFSRPRETYQLTVFERTPELSYDVLRHPNFVSPRAASVW